MDALADLLSRARATGSLFAETTMRGRGGVQLPSEGSPLAVHIVSRGDLWLRADGVGRPLVTGDVVLVRAPTAVAVTAGASERPAPLAALLGGDGAARVTGPGVRRLNLVGDGPPAVLLCGAYSLAGSICERLLDALPPVVHVPAAAAPPALRLVVELLVSELASAAPGQQTALDRILDLLLVHVLRAHFTSAGAGAPPWYVALDDPVVGTALRALHADPARAWTVAQLASEAALSRAAFARRFTALVGQPPLAYLTGWRMALAQEALRRDGSTLAAVAREVGYGSEFALSAAFTRRIGEPPSHWRARVHAARG